MPTQRQLERAERVREELASKRTTAEQVARLDLRLGVGVGAVKERAKLSNPVEKTKD